MGIKINPEGIEKSLAAHLKDKPSGPFESDGEALYIKFDSIEIDRDRASGSIILNFMHEGKSIYCMFPERIERFPQPINCQGKLRLHITG